MSKCNDKFNSIFADKLYSFVKFKQGMGWSYSDASRALVCFDKYVIVTSQQKWTRKSFKKRNESQYFVNLLKSTALFHGLLDNEPLPT